MAEVLGAVSASLHLAEKLIKYCRSFKSASEDAANLAEEMAALSQILGTLQESVQNPPPGLSFRQTSSLLSSLQNCEGRMQVLEASLAPHVSDLGNLLRRAKWPLRHRETVETVQALHRFAQIFHFASTSDGLVALSLPIAEAVRKLDNLQQSQDSSHRDVANALRLLPQVELQISGLTQKFDNFVNDAEFRAQTQASKEVEAAAYRDLCQMLSKIPTSEFEDRHRTLQLTRMEGGSRWIFDAPNYVAWHNASSTNTLWCNGGPGVGKTYLASVVIDELFALAKAASDDSIVLFFYFDYNKQVDQTPLRVLQTLVHQILSTHSRIPLLAEKMADDLMKRKPLPSWKDLSDLFIGLCSDARPVFIVLDALDECDAAANRKPILELIKEIKRSPARLLITSRPYPPDVDEVLGDCPQVAVEASDKDIQKYVTEQIEENVEMRRMLDDELKDLIVKSILKKSQGMFLLPALQINNILGQTNIDEVRDALEKLPTGLADNLSMTIERIKKQHGQNNSRSRLAFLVLQWLSTVRRPITTMELQHAIATQPGMERLGALTNPKFFVESCFGLTIIDKETSVVRLVHFSVKEFLELKRDELFDDPQSALATSCLTYMTICFKPPASSDQMGEGTAEPEQPEHLLADRWPFREYAACNWALHAGVSCVGLAETALKDFAFCQNVLDNWASYICAMCEEFKNEYAPERVEWKKCALRVGLVPSPLHIAAIYGLTDLAREYLTRGLDPNLRDGNGTTALMIAAEAPEASVGVLDLLLTTVEDKLDWNILDTAGRSALHYAAKGGSLDLFRYLLCRPLIDVNSGRALEAASAGSGCKQKLDLLLAHPMFSLSKMEYVSVIESVFILARGLERPEYVGILTNRPDFRVLGHPYVESELNTVWEYIRNSDYQYGFFGENHMHAVKNLPSMILTLDRIFSSQLDEPDAITRLFPFVYYAYAGFYRPPSEQPPDSTEGPATDLGVSIGVLDYDEDTPQSDQWDDSSDGSETNPSRSIDVDCDANKPQLNQSDDSSEWSEANTSRSVSIDLNAELAWPSSEAVVAFATERHIPSSMAPRGDENPEIYGISFWDEPGDPQRTGLRARMQREGISFATVDSKGRGFIHAVCRQTDGWISALIFLLAIGISPNFRDNTGQTPLHYAAGCGNGEAIDLLLVAGADVRAADNDGWTVLHSAAKASSLDVLIKLVGHGADVHASTIKKQTILHAAVGNTEEPDAMIRYLVEKGCRLDARDTDGFTPGFLSIYGTTEALKTCLELGQSPTAYDGPLGNSLLLCCVYGMLYDEGQLCLSYLGPPQRSLFLSRSPSPFSPESLINRVGSFGFSAFDYLGQFDRSVADRFGFTDRHWAAYTATPPAIRRKHLLHFFLERVAQMLLVAEKIDELRALLERAAHQLILLGDEESAVTILEQNLVPESRDLAVPIFIRNRIHCCCCQKREAPLFKCCVCAFVMFCTACRDRAPPRDGYNEAKQCVKGHRFIQVPGKEWKTRRDGTVNGRGQTLTEFLKELKTRYELELLAIDGV